MTNKEDGMAYDMTKDELEEAGIEAKNTLTFEFIKSNIQELEGQMLTLIDAVIEDKERRKATKDLARRAFSEKYDWLWEATYIVDVDENYSHQIIPIKGEAKGS